MVKIALLTREPWQRLILLGHPFHDLQYLLTECRGDFLPILRPQRITARIFNDVMQETSNTGILVRFPTNKQRQDADGMHQVGLPVAFAFHAPMDPNSHEPGLFEAWCEKWSFIHTSLYQGMCSSSKIFGRFSAVTRWMFH